MLICPILSPYLSGSWSSTECNNDASKNGDLLYFGGPCTDYQCHSETTNNKPHYQFEVTVTRPRPMRLS